MTSDIIKSIRAFQASLYELLKMCGVNKKAAKFPKPSKILLLLEKLSNDDSAVKYFSTLKKQVEEAKKLLEEKQLDYWNSEQNEKLLEECQRKLETLQKNPESAKTVGENRNVCDRKIVTELIHMLDQLQDKKTWLMEGDSENKLLESFLDSQIEEIIAILEHAGVQILKENGDFDKSMQRVVKTTETSAPELKNKVAETFRPGFLYDGTVLREQEVVVYVLAEEEDPCP